MEIFRGKRFQAACLELSKSLDNLAEVPDDYYSGKPLATFYGNVPDDPGQEKAIYLYRPHTYTNLITYRIEYVAGGNESDDRLREADLLWLNRYQHSITNKIRFEITSSRRYYLKHVAGPGPGSRESFKKIHTDPSYVNAWIKLIPNWEKFTI